MKCSQCGAVAPGKAAFCPQCGAKLSRTNADVDRPLGAAKIRPSGPPGTAHDVSEQDLWTGRYSPKAMSGPFFGSFVIAIACLIGASYVAPDAWMAVAVGAIAVFVYLLLLLLYRQMAVRYRLTNQRLLREIGILSRTDDRILVIDIDDITVKQTLVERMFNLGTILIVANDESSKEDGANQVKKDVVMLGIENPRHVADLIDEARRAERSRRGVYMMNA